MIAENKPELKTDTVFVLQKANVSMHAVVSL